MRRLVLFWFGCMMLGRLNSQAAGGDTLITPEKYIETYKDLAIAEMKRTGIPASITLAQGLLESGSGNSYLAKVANNHFGIKCKTGWAGRSVKVDDDELQECFRAYDKAEDSYRDHSDFLSTQARYADLFALDPTDYKSWAAGLKKDGYATNPRYPEKLIENVEKYALYQYDIGNKHPVPKQEQNLAITGKYKPEPGAGMAFLTMNKIPAYIVKTGDNQGTIADQYNMMRWEIRTYNDLKVNEPIPAGTIIYLKPKKRKGLEKFHMVKPGEGMYYISQAEGIKLKTLYKWNRMKIGEEPAPGQLVNLQFKKDQAPALLGAGTIVPRRGVMVSIAAKPVIRKDSALQNINLYKKEQRDSGNITPAKEKKSMDGTDSAGKYHIVQDGETIYGISKNYGVSYVNLKRWNTLNGNLESGQKIYITRPKTYRETPVYHKDSMVKTGKDTQMVYKVKPGETIYSVSAQFNIPVDTLIKINRLQHYTLDEGQIIRLRIKNMGPQNTRGATSQEWHTVLAGETLYSIARQYQVSVQELMEWNELEDNTLSVGQKLIVRK